MANVGRFFVGLLLLPACAAVACAFFDALMCASSSSLHVSAETIALLGGIASFAFAWAALSHPVRAYVLGHELTHALWGLLFGARPSDVRVGATGGSVRLSKSNVVITLAPYFFPFYTFLVIVVALVTAAFLRPLPFLPFWMFLIGFTWAFHVLFTIETLTVRQPDVRAYGRLFSWTVIFLVNVLIVLVWMAVTTPLTFRQLGGFLSDRLLGFYGGLFSLIASGIRALVSRFSSNA